MLQKEINIATQLQVEPILTINTVNKSLVLHSII